jgi:hypothetical protein
MKLPFLPKFLLLVICLLMLTYKAGAQPVSDLAYPKHSPVADNVNLKVGGSESSGGELVEVSVTEFEAMTTEQRSEVKAHPERYRLLGVGSLQPAGEENLGSSQPVLERYKVSKEELNVISPEKLAFMRAHPETYDLSNIDEQ